jgi:hypothetical protein
MLLFLVDESMLLLPFFHPGLAARLKMADSQNLT